MGEATKCGLYALGRRFIEEGETNDVVIVLRELKFNGGDGPWTNASFKWWNPFVMSDFVGWRVKSASRLLIYCFRYRSVSSDTWDRFGLSGSSKSFDCWQCWQ